MMKATGNAIVVTFFIVSPLLPFIKAAARAKVAGGIEA